MINDWHSFISGTIAGAAIVSLLLLAVEMIASHQKARRVRRFDNEK